MASQENGGQPSEAADGTKKDTTRDDDGKGGSAKDQGQDAPAEEKKPNRLAAVIAKLGLDAPTLITMFK
jgi:hypothetical protein